MVAGITVRIRSIPPRMVVLAAMLLLISTARATTETQALHVLDRLAFGPRPGDVQRVMVTGVDAYIKQQLHPDSIPMPTSLEEQLDALNTLDLTPAALFQQYGPRRGGSGKPSADEIKARRQRERSVLLKAMQARLLRAIDSPRQLQEVMVNFWFNHFNVFAGKGLDLIWTGAYEEQAIRPYALGHFRDLLFATTRHPAMLFYLDNWLNTEPGSAHARGRFNGINENYAREVMELHTLGVNGGYTQQDVTTLAHILTGWGLCPLRRLQSDSDGFCFDPQRHDFDNQMFLGTQLQGGGEEEVEQALTMLADSPVTAHHICYELAQYFVADQPDPALVAELTATWKRSDGDIAEVLNTLFHSPQFRSASDTGNKFKTPYEYVVSMVRATGEPVTNFKPLLGMLKQLGMPLYGYLTPEGYKNTQDAWLSPDAMTLRLSFATAIGSGRARLNPVQTDSVSPQQLAAQLPATLAGLLPGNVYARIDSQPMPLRAAMILGSPQFQYR